MTLAAIAKGSGMIAPQLATMIAVLVTDAALVAGRAQAAIAGAARETFNRLTIDGDMSTNDCVLALANGRAGDRCRPTRSTAAVRDLFRELARAIAADGEGATKRLEVRVTGAPDAAIAADLARAIAGSHARQGRDVRRRSELGPRARDRRRARRLAGLRGRPARRRASRCRA